MVYIGNDDPTRGDSHGFAGIGARMAQKLNGSYSYLEDKHLKALYPKISPHIALRHYFKDHGKPDIMLSRYYIHHGTMTSHVPLLTVSDINEYLSSELLGERSLVSHHLTPELLEEEGKKFRAHYPDIAHPLIAVTMVNIRNIDAFAQKLVSKCAAYDACTVFLCSSRRTEHDNYAQLKSTLEKLAAEKGLTEKINVTGYNHHVQEPDAFNPYIGLLDTADHVIVAGESLSMQSEPLAAGKPVIVFESCYTHTRLKKEGLMIDFNACANDTRFEERRIAPVNITENIADRLIEKFNRAAKERAHTPIGWTKATVAKIKTMLNI